MLNKGIKEDKGEKRPLGFLFLSSTFFLVDDPILEDYDFILFFYFFLFLLSRIPISFFWFVF
jgi:hypothetical protein